MGIFDNLFEKEETKPKATKKKGRTYSLDKKKAKVPQGHYSMKAKCSNCSNKQEIIIPQGKESKTFIRGIKCEKCGLSKLRALRNQNDLFDNLGNSSFDDIFDDFLESAEEEKEETESIKSLSQKGKIAKIPKKLLIKIQTKPTLNNYVLLEDFNDILKLANHGFLVNVYSGKNETIYFVSQFYFIDKG